MLLKRERVDVVTAIERLAALQAQWPRAPYVGLWSRLATFERDDLESALTEGTVLKATLMRGTLHLASARDYPGYAVAAPEARRAAWSSTQATLLRGMSKSVPEARRYVAAGGTGIRDAAKFHERLLRHAATPRSRDDFVELIVKTERVPRGVAQFLVWNFIASFGMLVHVPESGMFAANRAGDVVAARVALTSLRVPPLTAAAVHLVRRYLAAFGPSSIDDVSSWTSMRTPTIRHALETLAPELLAFHDERGRLLYDLAKAPRPSEDTPAPVRFLPKWDSTLLAFTPAERIRILPAG